MRSLKPNLQNLQKFFKEFMRAWDIPAMQIAIVEDYKVIWQKGFSSSHELSVNEHTLMKIGSITKTMTSLLISQMVDEGYISWDDKVKDLCPEFDLLDSKLAHDMTLKDLLVQGSLRRYDLPLLLSKKPLLEQIKNTPLISQHQFFHYNNQMVVLAGYIITKLLKKNEQPLKAFQELMKEKIFHPLGMEHTCFEPLKATSYPYGKDIKGNTQRLTMQCEKDAWHPAGGVWSNVVDLSRYMIMELKKGVTPNGKRVFSKEAVIGRHKKYSTIGGYDSYGMGYYINEAEKETCIFSDGLTHGFCSRMSFFPHHGCGFIILTNVAMQSIVLDIISDAILHCWFDVPKPIVPSLEVIFPHQEENIVEDWSLWNGVYESPECGELVIVNGIMHLGKFSLKIVSVEGRLLCCEPPFTFLALDIEEDKIVIQECHHQYIFHKVLVRDFMQI